MSKDPSHLDFSKLVSPDRFSTYLNATDGELIKARRLYVWNAELAGAWWGPISLTEVVIRNSLNRQMAATYGDSWWHADPFPANAHTKGKVDEALYYLDKKNVLSPSSGDVVGASTFGLWTGLLHRANAQRLWRGNLEHVFSNDPGHSCSRGRAFELVTDVKRLRDKIAHHEPIFSEHHEQMFRSLVLLLRHVDSEVSEYVDAASGLRSVIRARNEVLEHGDCSL
ncbi:hypothetical protein ACYB2S_12505 [Corynebacterium variabile]|uniref:hypothetical protein n=1 Tax=Corynebacterium variabile TaxID=1727 RepID=UPI003CC34979